MGIACYRKFANTSQLLKTAFTSPLFSFIFLLFWISFCLECLPCVIIAYIAVLLNESDFRTRQTVVLVALRYWVQQPVQIKVCFMAFIYLFMVPDQRALYHWQESGEETELHRNLWLFLTITKCIINTYCTWQPIHVCNEGRGNPHLVLCKNVFWSLNCVISSLNSSKQVSSLEICSTSAWNIFSLFPRTVRDKISNKTWVKWPYEMMFCSAVVDLFCFCKTSQFQCSCKYDWFYRKFFVKLFCQNFLYLMLQSVLGWI